VGCRERGNSFWEAFLVIILACLNQAEYLAVGDYYGRDGIFLADQR
jgi:hypothetical protein